MRRELTTTFASSYSDTVSLTDLLDPVVVTAVAKKGTGQKYLVAPNGV